MAKFFLSTCPLKKELFFAASLMFLLLLLWFLFFTTLYENVYLHCSRTKTLLYEFIVVMCCISLNMQYLQSLLKFKIFKIKIPNDSLFIFLILNAFLITVYHFKAVQDDIFVKLFPSDCIKLCSVDKSNLQLIFKLKHLHHFFFLGSKIVNNQRKYLVWAGGHLTFSH